MQQMQRWWAVVRWLVTGVLVYTLLPGLAGAACSSYIGRVVFNEVADGQNVFVELKLMDTTIASETSNFAGWTLELYKNNNATLNTVDFGTFYTGMTNSCSTAARWVTVPDASLGNRITGSNPASKLNFVLKDNSGNIVDVLRMASSGAFSSFYTGACTTIDNTLSANANTKYDAAWASNGHKDWYRTADGSGNWTGTSSSGTATTSCKNNDSSTSAPTITTVAASGISATAATLNGTVNPVNSATTVSFTYGTTSGSYTNTCSVAGSYTGTTNQSFSCNVSALTCNTTYYYVARGSNSSGVNIGSELSFTTSACATGVASFAAYESNISNTSAATVANRIIQTRVASTSGNLCPSGVATTAATLPTGAKTCSLTIAALTATPAVNTSYSGSVAVKLQYCSNVSRSGSGVSSTVSCGGTWTDLTTAQTVNLAAGVGIATFANVANAYEMVRVSMTSASLSLTSTSTDAFAIRPTALTVTATDGSATSAGSARSLTDGSVTHRAARPFTVNAQAHVTSSATTVSAYPATGAGPVVQSAVNASPAGGVNGTLSLGTLSGTGTLTSNTATYTEVGTFTLTLQDQDFANVDLSDGSSTAERYFSGSATIGRFTPDHFRVVVTPGCSTFTYAGLSSPALTGQSFSIQITARNGSSNPTLNYGLTTNTVGLSDAASNLAGGLSTTTLDSANFDTDTGIATTGNTYVLLNKATAPLSVVVRATDADGISSNGYETAAAMTVLSGRLRLSNAYGSDLLPLPLPTVVEYYDTSGFSGWRQGSGSYTDTCTALTASQFGFSSGSACTTAIGSCITAVSLSATGTDPYKSPWTVRLAKPVAAGNVCVSVNLDGGSSGKQCTATGTPGPIANSVVAPWLKFGWAASSVMSNPSARATFGIYKSPLIYRRENH